MDEPITAHDASAEAIHKTRNAAQAVEAAREAQLAEAIAKTAAQTKEALLEALTQVFGEGDEKDPNQMRILVRRIPILCTSVESMHRSLRKIENNQTWVVRIVIGAVLVAALKLVLLP